MKTCQDVINYLIERNNYTSFLEIGVRDKSLSKIQCAHKDGVDPVPGRCNYTMTSDKFFDTIDDSKSYDIIFVDGLHEKDQVMRDILNSLSHLNEGGCILCHDVNPLEEHLLQPRYCSDAWEAYAELRATRDDLEMYTLNIDHGPGILRKGSQEPFNTPIEYTWNFLDANRRELLNEISVDEFKEIF